MNTQQQQQQDPAILTSRKIIRQSPVDPTGKCLQYEISNVCAPEIHEKKEKKKRYD